jgi:hypothetical protein
MDGNKRKQTEEAEPGVNLPAAGSIDQDMRAEERISASATYENTSESFQLTRIKTETE